MVILISAGWGLHYRSVSHAKALELRKKAQQLQSTTKQKKGLEEAKKELELKMQEEAAKYHEELKRKETEIERIKVSKAQEEARRAAARKRQLANAQARPAPSLRASASEIRPRFNFVGLTGSKGWAKPYGNCVNTARAFGKVQPGNPIAWRVSTRTPFIGAAALFKYNHVAIVAGIYDNGDIEVYHENFRGGRTRFKASEIRGYF